MTAGLGPLRRSVAALRIAGKQVRKRPRKSVLIVALVALPSTVMMMIGTVYASQNPTTGELITSRLGGTEASIHAVQPDGVAVSVDPVTGEFMDTSGLTTPEGPYADVRSLFPAETRLLTLDQSNDAVVDTGTRAFRVGGTVGEAWDPALGGKFDVVEGATPTGPGQVMLSPDAAKRLDVGVGAKVLLGRPGHEVTVVGLLGSRDGYWSGMVYALPEDLTALDDPTARTWYVPELAVDASLQSELNGHGLMVFSREVTQAERTEGPVGSGWGAFTNAAGNSGISATAGVGAFELLLLAGAGFVVSMRSNQRSLALLAATGAPRGTLVSVGVATGVWLGLLGGVAGVPLGVGFGWAWVWFQTHHGGTSGAGSMWGYHVAWEHAVITVVFAVVVSALSSLIPALIAARVDVVASLRGSRRPARPRMWPALVGAVLAVAAVVVFMSAARIHAHSWVIPRDLAQAERTRAAWSTTAAVVLGLAGASFAAPLALRGLARTLAPVGVAARIAARDAARHAGRTVPVVAAIAVTVLAATLGAVTAAHEAALQDGQIADAMPYGDGSIYLDLPSDGDPAYADPEAVTAAVLEAAPDATAVAVQSFQDIWVDSGKLVVTLAMPPANICPLTLAGGESFTEQQVATDPRCDRSGDMGNYASGIVVGGAEQLAVLLAREPSAQELKVLADGGAVVFSPQYVEADTARFAVWDYAAGNLPYSDDLAKVSTPSRAVDLPAVLAPPTLSHLGGFTAVISPATAASLGGVVVPNRVLVHVEGGVSRDQQDQIQGALLRVGDVWLQVEHPQSDYALYYALMSLGGVLLMAGACTAIALGLARQEAAHDDATLASIGAAPSLTKSVAAWQAGITVGLAGVIGVGLGSGVAWVTSRDVATGRLVAPWLLLALALVAVPTLVASLAWVFTRAPQVIHYRLAA